MKPFLLVLCLLVLKPGALFASEATPPSARQAVQADYRCAVQHLYQSTGTASGSLSAAVDYCVSFERGAGAWYLRHTARDTAVDVPRRAVVLQRVRSMTLVYLQQAVPRCQRAQVDESGCLQMLKL